MEPGFPTPASLGLPVWVQKRRLAAPGRKGLASGGPGAGSAVEADAAGAESWGARSFLEGGPERQVHVR